MLKNIHRTNLVRPVYRSYWERKYGVEDKDVFLVSYPRSGNTWVRFMLLQARPAFHNEDFTRIQEIIPDMHGEFPWHSCERTRIVKSHLTYWQPFRRVIYLVRNGRAATFSNWRYQVAEGKYTGSFEDFVTKSHWPSTWSDHVNGWTRARETQLIVRYEDLVADPATQLRRMIDVIGWEISDLRIQEIVASSTKDRMRQLEQGEGVALHRVGDDRSDWRDAFNDRLEKSFGRTLNTISNGYLKM